VHCELLVPTFLLIKQLESKMILLIECMCRSHRQHHPFTSCTGYRDKRGCRHSK